MRLFLLFLISIISASSSFAIDTLLNDQLIFVESKNNVHNRVVSDALSYTTEPWISAASRDYTLSFITTDFQSANGFVYRTSYNHYSYRVYTDSVTPYYGDSAIVTTRTPYTTQTAESTARYSGYLSQLFSGTNSPKHSGGIYTDAFFVMDPVTHKSTIQYFDSTLDSVLEKSADVGRLYVRSVKGKDKKIRIKLFGNFQIDTITDQKFGPKEIPPPLQIPAKSFDPKRFNVSVMMSDGSIYPKSPTTIPATRIDNVTSVKVSTATSLNGDGTKYAEFVNYRTTGKLYAEFDVVPRISDVIGIGVVTDYGFMTLNITSISAEPVNDGWPPYYPNEQILNEIRQKFVDLCQRYFTKFTDLKTFNFELSSLSGDSVFTFHAFSSDIQIDFSNYQNLFTFFRSLLVSLTSFAVYRLFAFSRHR